MIDDTPDAEVAERGSSPDRSPSNLFDYHYDLYPIQVTQVPHIAPHGRGHGECRR